MSNEQGQEEKNGDLRNNRLDSANAQQAESRNPGARSNTAAFHHIKDADLLALVEFAFAREQRLAREELGEDAADTPHVDRGAVGLCAQQQLFFDSIDSGRRGDGMRQLGRRRKKTKIVRWIAYAYAREGANGCRDDLRRPEGSREAHASSSDSSATRSQT